MNDFFKFPLISEKEQQGIYGAYGGSNSENGYDLGEVVVTPDYGGGDYGDYGGGNPWGFGDEPDYGGNGGGMPDDFYDGLNGEWILVDGVPTFEITLDGGEVIKAKADTTPDDAIAALLMSMGLAATHADVALGILNLEKAGISITSNAFAVLDVGLNVAEMFDSEGNFTWNWEDGGQAILGTGLIIVGLVGTGPVAAGVVIVGGVALAGWELYEMLNDD